MRNRTLLLVPIGLGCLLLLVGGVTQALASGNNGLCSGQIKEEKKNKVWRATGHICAGLCPVPAPPQHTDCELAISGSSRQYGGKVEFPYACACVTYGPDPRWPGSEMVIMTQFDRVDPADPQSDLECDVESWWPYGASDARTIGCNGHCPGALCRKNPQAVNITNGVRVRAPGCICP